jgi:type II secretory pathway predicted ATPase ExeA
LLESVLRRALRRGPEEASPDPFPAAAAVGTYVPRADFEQALAYLAAKLSETPSFVGICGAPGVGKTLMLRLLMLRCPQFEPIYVPTARLEPPEIERWIAAWRSAHRKSTVASFRRRLTREERPLLVVVDDCDVASAELLDWLDRLCSPSSQARGAIAWSDAHASRAANAKALARCSTRAFLEPLELAAIEPYVEALLAQAGATPEQRSLFSGDVMKRIALASGGNPRAIHRLANAELVAQAWRRARTVGDAGPHLRQA